MGRGSRHSASVDVSLRDLLRGPGVSGLPKWLQGADERYWIPVPEATRWDGAVPYRHAPWPGMPVEVSMSLLISAINDPDSRHHHNERLRAWAEQHRPSAWATVTRASSRPSRNSAGDVVDVVALDDEILVDLPDLGEVELPASNLNLPQISRHTPIRRVSPALAPRVDAPADPRALSQFPMGVGAGWCVAIETVSGDHIVAAVEAYAAQGDAVLVNGRLLRSCDCVSFEATDFPE